jgi:hypothetical protein
MYNLNLLHLYKYINVLTGKVTTLIRLLNKLNFTLIWLANEKINNIFKVEI